MANSLSAAKRARQNTVRRERNARLRSRLRTIHKKFLKSLEKKSDLKDQREALFQDAVREWDRAWSKGIVKRNNASRHISRLHKRLQAAQAG